MILFWSNYQYMYFYRHHCLPSLTANHLISVRREGCITSSYLLIPQCTLFNSVVNEGIIICWSIYIEKARITIELHGVQKNLLRSVILALLQSNVSIATAMKTRSCPDALQVRSIKAYPNLKISRNNQLLNEFEVMGWIISHELCCMYLHEHCCSRSTKS